MPQMAPMMWLNLLMMTSMVILMINSCNYFNNKIYTKKPILNSLKNKNWLW